MHFCILSARFRESSRLRSFGKEQMPVFRERMVINMKRELQTATLPVVALRGLVIFPKMMLHFDIGRKKSTAAPASSAGLERGDWIVGVKGKNNINSDNYGILLYLFHHHAGGDAPV